MSYTKVKLDTDNELHLIREPSLWSWAVLAGFVSFGFAAAWYGSENFLWKCVYLSGAIFVGLTWLEEWEECCMNKMKNEIKLHRCTIFTKVLRIGTQQSVVTCRLGDVVGIRVDEHTVRYVGRGHQVVLMLANGIALGITEAFTYGPVSDHYAIADKVRRFLDLDNAHRDNDEYLGDTSSSEESFEQIEEDEIDENFSVDPKT